MHSQFVPKEASMSSNKGSKNNWECKSSTVDNYFHKKHDYTQHAAEKD